MMQGAVRRLSVAAFALTLAAGLFRAQLAEALVVRGDDFLIQNRYGSASERYARALWFDSGSQSAADRYIFVALERRTPRELRMAIEIADVYLSKQPSDPVILFDRALCYLILRQYRFALLDFERTAGITRDPQIFVFAGWAARRAGRRNEAIGLWRAALRFRPGYLPARAALAESGR
jgi:tetratricopeptide (TPR) repeat protein